MTGPSSGLHSPTPNGLSALEDRVRDAAIKIIDDGSSLDRWREAGKNSAEQRHKVLLALKKKLLSPQPAAKVMKHKTVTKIATRKPGELFCFRLRSGRLVVLCLESIDKNHHGELSALDWIGDSVPDAKALKSLKRKPLFLKRMSPKAKTLWGVIAYKKRDIPYDRMAWLDVRIRPEPDTIRRRWTHESWASSTKTWSSSSAGRNWSSHKVGKMRALVFAFIVLVTSSALAAECIGGGRGLRRPRRLGA